MKLSRSAYCLLGLLFLCAGSGCGKRPLARLEIRPGCPWEAAGTQVQVGQRSMGKSFYGDIWKEFWIDGSGQEYDPELLSQKVWKYLDACGQLKMIDAARQNGQPCPEMRIICVNPTVVLMIPSQAQRPDFTGSNPSQGTRVVQELAWTPQSLPDFVEPMHWLSPDLKTGPTSIQFSAEGQATISLPTGRVVLSHRDHQLVIAREAGK